MRSSPDPECQANSAPHLSTRPTSTRKYFVFYNRAAWSICDCLVVLEVSTGKCLAKAKTLVQRVHVLLSSSVAVAITTCSFNILVSEQSSRLTSERILLLSQETRTLKLPKPEKDWCQNLETNLDQHRQSSSEMIKPTINLTKFLSS